MENKGVFITGIDTDVGKTIVSAILTESWKADYFKPIQAGNLNNPDSALVQSLISNSTSTIHPSQFNLSTAASPHYAAELEGIHLQVKDITLPRTNQPFILEGAGGIMVPISREEKILDLIIHLNIPVILVVKNYLGAINHALLSLEILQLHQVKIMGLIYNGGDRSENQSIIEHFSKIPTLGIIPEIDSINPNAILTEAAKFADINPFH